MVANKEKAKFCVFYDANGESVGVELVGTGCEIIAEGEELKEQLKMGGYDDLFKKVGARSGTKVVEFKAHVMQHFHGSPGCIIYINNYPFCICCR